MSEVKKSITQVDRSTKALESAVASFAKQTNDLKVVTETLGKTINSQLFEIEAKEAELQALTKKVSDGERVAKAELSIKVQENEDKVLADLLKARSLVTIAPVELDQLQADLRISIETKNQEIEAAIGKANGMAKSKLEQEVQTLKLQQAADTANLQAELKFAKESLVSKDAQIKQLQAQIDSDRTARVEIAKSDAAKQAAVVNVSK